ncbi:MAG TPA: PAS domain S-box protein [Geobacteraceae bacterium]|nr:PAS domain S-box protein [Geobacteraceae bacterium]
MNFNKKSADSTVSPAVFISRLAAGILLINLFVIFLAGLSLRQSRVQNQERAAITTQNLAHVLEQNIGGTVDKIDVVLRFTAENIEKQIAGGAINPRELNRFLARQSSRLPELAALRMADAQGRIAYGTGSPVGIMTSVADRDYFRRLHNDPTAGLFISRAIVSRVTGKWVVLLARRVNRPDGAFAGVVYGVIPLEHFTKLFASIDVGKHGSIALRDGDLGIIVRYPELKGAGISAGQKTVSVKLRQLLKAGRDSGTYITEAPIDHIERTFTFHKIFNYPLYIIAGLATGDYLVEWRNEVVIMSVTAAIFFFITVFTSWLIYRDWKRRKAAVQALVRQEEKFRTIADYTYDWEFWLAPDGSFIHTSPSCERVTGYSADAFYSDPDLLHRIVHPDDMELFARHRHDSEPVKGPGSLVLRIRRADGAVCWLEHVCQPVIDESGTFLGTRGSNRDITERKRAENESFEQLHFLQQLLDSVPIPVFYKNPDGVYLGCNKAFQAFIGLPREQIVGKTVYDLAPKDLADIYQEADSVLYIRQGVQVYEGSLLHADGTRHDVIFSKASYVDANGNVSGMVGAIMDITERKNLEAQLNQAQKMEAVGQLAGGIAHDFNNVLTAIIGYAEVVMMRMEKDNPLRHYVEQVLNSAGRAAELTSGLLAFSRKQVLHPRSLNLGETVLDVKKMLGRLILEDIDFRTTVADIEMVVMADKGQLVQVLMNLVTNAGDAMPNGGILSIDVSPAVMDEKFVHAHGFGEPGKYACISVADTGSGMDEETKKKIFEPFFTTKEVGKGTGLGLAIIYGIIKQHNGYIAVESTPGKGTTFRVYLPLTSTEARADDSRREEPPAGGTETILLAEDDASVRELHRTVLEEAGYTVIEAVDGRDALDKFMARGAEVDIVAADVVMPKIDGKRMYEEITKVRPGVRVLFMSGYTKDIIDQRGIMEDEFEFMTKPVMPSELLKKVRKILDRE